MRERENQNGITSEDFFSFEKSEAKKKIDKVIKKHGKRSGSGYTINVEQLLKILEGGEGK